VNFSDDDQTRRALHAVADAPAPPAVTTVGEVIHRGRRRVVAQRAATVAAVVGVVAGIGVGGVLLRSAVAGDGVRPAVPVTSGTATSEPTPSVPTTSEPTPSVPMTGTPSSAPAEPPSATSQGEFRIKPVPGWAPVGDSGAPDVGCGSSPAVGVEPGLDLPPRAAVEKTFVDKVTTLTGSLPHVVDGSWELKSPDTGAPYTFLEYNVDMGDGPGSVILQIGHYSGPPMAMADADAAAYGNCARPLRRTLPDGTVLQLFPADFRDPSTPSQDVVVYAPGGRHYLVDTAGWGKSDEESGVIVSGRGRLPLDDSGLADVAAALAELGK
jgi:hypothetical protein